MGTFSNFKDPMGPLIDVVPVQIKKIQKFWQALALSGYNSVGHLIRSWPFKVAIFKVFGNFKSRLNTISAFLPYVRTYNKPESVRIEIVKNKSQYFFSMPYELVITFKAKYLPLQVSTSITLSILSTKSFFDGIFRIRSMYLLRCRRTADTRSHRISLAEALKFWLRR